MSNDRDWMWVVPRLGSLREAAKDAVEHASVTRIQYIFHNAVTPSVVLALLDYIEELEVRAGEKDPEDG